MWYDKFSHVYDASIEWLYRSYRPIATEALRLSSGDTVVDLACGTGQNFPCLREAVGAEGRIVGVDMSPGMLRRAQKRIDRAGWGNVSLLEMDAGAVRRSHVGSEPGQEVLADAVLCTLGLSAIPGWQEVLANGFSLLRRGGTFCIFDVFAERWVPQTSIVTMVAQADLKRQSWMPLKALSADFEMRFLPGSPHLHGGRLFLATGVRGDAWDTSEAAQAVAAARLAAESGDPSEPAGEG